jgi:hypothetical protein
MNGERTGEDARAAKIMFADYWRTFADQWRARPHIR